MTCDDSIVAKKKKKHNTKKENATLAPKHNKKKENATLAPLSRTETVSEKEISHRPCYTSVLSPQQVCLPRGQNANIPPGFNISTNEVLY